MSLNNQDLAQKKVKSLRDLFGGSLTEEGKAILDRAADSAARDLTLAVFGPEDRPSSEVSDALRRETLKVWVKYPEPSQVENGYVIAELNKLLEATKIDDKKASLTYLKALGRKASSAYKSSSDNAPIYSPINHLPNFYNKLKQVDIQEVKGQENEVSLFRSRNDSVHDLNISGIKTELVMVRDETGKTFFAILPMMLKQDSAKTLPKLVRNRRQTHKVK